MRLETKHKNQTEGNIKDALYIIVDQNVTESHFSPL